MKKLTDKTLEEVAGGGIHYEDDSYCYGSGYQSKYMVGNLVYHKPVGDSRYFRWEILSIEPWDGSYEYYLYYKPYNKYTYAMEDTIYKANPKP